MELDRKIILAAALTLGTAGAAADVQKTADAYPNGIAAGADRINVRYSPDSSSALIGTIAEGVKIHDVYVNGNWSKTSCDQKGIKIIYEQLQGESVPNVCYIASDYVTPVR